MAWLADAVYSGSRMAVGFRLWCPANLNQYQGENYIKLNPQRRHPCKSHFGFSLGMVLVRYQTVEEALTHIRTFLRDSSTTPR